MSFERNSRWIMMILFRSLENYNNFEQLLTHIIHTLILSILTGIWRPQGPWPPNFPDSLGVLWRWSEPSGWGLGVPEELGIAWNSRGPNGEVHDGSSFWGVLGEGLEPLSLGEEPLSLGVESVDGCLVMSAKQKKQHKTTCQIIWVLWQIYGKS